jgi:hypothetical protein
MIVEELVGLLTDIPVKAKRNMARACDLLLSLSSVLDTLSLTCAVVFGSFF